MKLPSGDSEKQETKYKQLPDSLSGAMRELAPFTQFGIMMALSIYIMNWVGNHFDEKWNTEPWLTLAGILFAIAASFYHLFRAISNTSDKKNKPQ